MSVDGVLSGPHQVQALAQRAGGHPGLPHPVHERHLGDRLFAIAPSGGVPPDGAEQTHALVVVQRVRAHAAALGDLSYLQEV